MIPLFCLIRGCALELFERGDRLRLWLPAAQLALLLADGLLLLHAARFAGRNKPALAAHGAQHFAAGDFLAKTLQQGALRFSRP